MKSRFASHSVAYPLHEGEFSQLDDKTKKKLLRLMARISEMSYRRGYQHGGLETRKVDPVHFRNRVSLDKAPFTDVYGVNGKWVCTPYTSMGRLRMEYGGALEVLGFNFPKSTTDDV